MRLGRKSPCRQMIKVCRKMSRPTTADSAMLCLQRPASTAGREARGSHERTTFRRPDHRRRPVRHRYRLSRAWPTFPTRPSPCWSDGSGWAAPGTCSGTPAVRSDSDMFTFGYKFRPWQDREGPRRRPVHPASTSPDTRRSSASTRRSTTVLKVVSADWSSPQSRWTVTTLHEASGETRTYSCNYLISCTGYYNYDAGYLPTFPVWTSSRVGAFTHSSGRRIWTTRARRSS